MQPFYFFRSMAHPRLDPDEFIRRMKAIHGDSLLFDKTHYTTCNDKVTVTCPVHGDFPIHPQSLARGCGCEKCKRGWEVYDTPSFIKKAQSIHGDRYTYEHVVYKNNDGTIFVTCPEHGIFKTTPTLMLAQKSGCPKCFTKRHREEISMTRKEFVERVQRMNGDLYDLSKSKYKNTYSQIEVVCRKHGPFKTMARNLFTSKWSCKGCAEEHEKEKRKAYTKRFIEKATKIHKGKYDYSKIGEIGCHTIVTIICPIHGEFQQEAGEHLNGRGCKKCHDYKGETAVSEYLKEHGIAFRHDVRVDSNLCPNVSKMFRVDFILTGRGVIIEYNGIQHYEPIEEMGGIAAFIHQKIRDYRLRVFCNREGLKLIEIPYTEFDHIEDVLDKELNF